jgi:hypothetical protein
LYMQQYMTREECRNKAPGLPKPTRVAMVWRSRQIDCGIIPHSFYTIWYMRKQCWKETPKRDFTDNQIDNLSLLFLFCIAYYEYQVWQGTSLPYVSPRDMKRQDRFLLALFDGVKIKD